MGECGSKGRGCAAVATPDPNPNTAGTTLTQARYSIENMDCPTEEALIRDKLGKVQGVGGLGFNLAQRTLAISHQPDSLRPIEEALSAIGMRAVRMDEKTVQQSTILSIQQMDCPTEEALIRGKRHWRGAHWPAFNLADIAISFGAVCLIAAAIRQGKSADRNQNTNEDWIFLGASAKMQYAIFKQFNRIEVP
jgi:cation transport ATPase